MPFIDTVAQGGNQFGSWAAGWDVRDVWDDLVRMDIAAQVPFDQLLRASRFMKKAENVKQEYYRRDAIIPREAVVAEDTVGAAAGNTDTVEVDDATRFNVGETFGYVVGGTTHVAYIEAVSYSTNVLTFGTLDPAAVISNIKAAVAYAASPVITADTVIRRISSAKGERHAPSGLRRNNPQAGFNLCQTFDYRVDHSTHALGTKNYTQREKDAYEAEVKATYRRDINAALYDGVMSVTLDAQGNFVWTFDGVFQHGLEDFGYTAGALTESQLIDLGYQVGTGNNGSKVRIALCGKDVMKDADKVLLSKLEHNENRTIAGMEMKGLKTGPVTLFFQYDPTLDEIGRPHMGVIVDPANMVKAEFQPLTPTQVNFRKSGQADAEGEWGQEIFCPLFVKPESFLTITASEGGE